MKKFIGVLVLMTMVLTLSAQEKKEIKRVEFNKQGFMQANPAKMIPSLTTEQRAEMAKLRVENLKNMLNFENRLLEKRVQLRILEQTDKPDIKKINEKIDEITDIENMKMKSAAAHKVKVRALLTDDQKVWMDSANNRRFSNKGNQFANRNRSTFTGNRAPMTGKRMNTGEFRNRQGEVRFKLAPGAAVKPEQEIKEVK
ncbi:MAG: hypothetical protein PHP30_01735 [Bacteroidales bacterium]|nr:hypothetical protein [Bacteroidales bacterium]MDD2425408.1 hypothetical protein [Bacteroidales bacterium]MDD3988810.1 hypothetical protein [Bacteroidales bacterium]MDD4639330.1 hypothetical protein [Bacteroidales bacterium]